MELTRISEWFDRESGYIPQVGSDVVLYPILAQQDWLNLRFVDHLGLSLQLYLNPLDVERLITFVTVQRSLKLNEGKGLPSIAVTSNYHLESQLSVLSNWCDENAGEIQEDGVNVKLIDIKVKCQEHLSADLMNPENIGKEYYVLDFEAQDDGMGLEILLSRIDVNRIIYFEDARRRLSKEAKG